MKRVCGVLAFAGLVIAHVFGAGSAINGDQEGATSAVDSLWYNLDSTAVYDTTMVDTVAVIDTSYVQNHIVADTTGPVLVAGCPKSRVMASWKGDSVVVTVQASIDRINWAAVYGPSYLGTEDTQGSYLHMLTHDNVAAGSVLSAATAGGYAYLRLIATCADASSPATGYHGRIQCVR